MTQKKKVPQDGPQGSRPDIEAVARELALELSQAGSIEDFYGEDGIFARFDRKDAQMTPPLGRRRSAVGTTTPHLPLAFDPQRVRSGANEIEAEKQVDYQDENLPLGLSAPESPKGRPSLWVLIPIAIILHMVTVVVDIALLGGELAGAIVEPGPVSELFLGGAAFFLTNLDIAFSVYVYRVAFAPPSEAITVNLNPLDLWGLKGEK